MRNKSSDSMTALLQVSEDLLRHARFSYHTLFEIFFFAIDRGGNFIFLITQGMRKEDTRKKAKQEGISRRGKKSCRLEEHLTGFAR